jgi:UDP-N-acetyl-D-glucosamine/UDP-N-acetyl-D-galactosamine dehydrogenase
MSACRLGRKPGRVLILGLTFKDNVPDLRNSSSFDLLRGLLELGYNVDDPVADADELANGYGLELAGLGGRYDLVVAAVGHDAYRQLTPRQIETLVADGGTVADIKGIWRDLKLRSTIDRWSL